MPFGQQRNNNSTTTTTSHHQNNSILAQTLFNTSNQITFDNHQPTHNHHHQQQQQQQQQFTQSSSTMSASAAAAAVANSGPSEAIIVQSNGGTVSDEILLQLQEQVGEGKQIYVLNSEDDDNVQYLIVDKDADISAILQDPSIFQATNSSTTTTIINDEPTHKSTINNQQTNNQSTSSSSSSSQQQQQQQQTQYIIVQNNPMSVEQLINETSAVSSSAVHNNHHNNQSQHHIHHHHQQQQHHHQPQQVHHNSRQSHQSLHNRLNNSTIASIEESVQRVTVPPPKRKIFEFQLENRKYSYQNAFLKFLAGEKQPTLEVIAEQMNRRPKENFLNYLMTGNRTVNGNNNNNNTNANNKQQSNITVNTSQQQQQQQQQANTSTTASSTNGTSTTTNGSTPQNTFIDKENYYNASRRENLLPLANYDYRNSYKDHYDQQGVRVNPAILKALPSDQQQPQTSSSSSSSSSSQQQQQNRTNSNSSIIVSSNESSTNKQPPSDIEQKSSHLINDVSQLINYPNTSNDINSQNGSVDNIDLDALAKESALTNARPTTNTLVDHTYKIKQQQQQQHSQVNNNSNESQKQTPQIINNNNNNNNNARKRAKANQADSSDDEEKLKKKFKKSPNSKDDLTTPTKQHNGGGGDLSSKQQSDCTIDEQKQQLLNEQQQQIIDEVTFTPGEFLIHKSTFTDPDLYDIWCVRDDGYLQKYEPVYLSTGERCHQSADVLAQYTADKTEFMLVKVEEKGKTEQNNIVVCVLPEYEPKNRLFSSSSSTTQQNLQVNNEQQPEQQQQQQQQQPISPVTNQPSPEESLQKSTNQQLLTYDDLKPQFDVFIQILLSQSLNSEFLSKISDLQDDYFRPALNLIESIISDKYAIVSDYTKLFIDSFKQIIDEKPKLEIEIDRSYVKTHEKCQAFIDTICDDNCFILKLFGATYNPDTLLINDDKDNLREQEFRVCSKACKLSEIYHSLKHIKINFYEFCSQKIEQVKNEINDNASDVLHSCLADTQWLSEIFEKFKKILIDIDEYLTDSTSTATTTPIPSITNTIVTE